jgi:hypothetical protein
LQAQRLSFSFEPQFWRWKYAEVPGAKQLTAVAYTPKGIIGAWGVVPFRLKVGQQTWVGCQDVDHFIVKEYRRGNTFLSLQRFTAQLKREHGMAFSYGVPVKSLKRIGVRLFKYREIGQVRKYVKVLNEVFFVQPYLKKRWLVQLAAKLVHGVQVIYSLTWRIGRSHFSVGEIHRFDDSFDGFWSQVAEHFPVAVVRDSKYLNWRFTDVPGINYKILKAEKEGRVFGYIVLKVDGENPCRGYIMDLIAKNVAVLQDLVKASLGYFQSRGVDVVVFWILGPPVIRNALKRFGFMERPLDRALIFKAHNPGFPLTLAEDLNNWYLTTADCDMH